MEYIQSKAYYEESKPHFDVTKKEMEDAIHLNISDFFLNNHSLYSDYDDTIDVLFDDFKDLEK
ncbi:MAG: hypothetical protein KGV44_05745 [Flavobacteriaceae bacterium]|nr:hypothetical protein [Flavobacteriaceae bacterium]